MFPLSAHPLIGGALQALIGTAIGLPPSAFRLMLQNNGAATALRFEPAPEAGAPALVRVEHVNQVASLSYLEGSQAAAAGHVRVYLVPLGLATPQAGMPQGSSVAVLQVRCARLRTRPGHTAACCQIAKGSGMAEHVRLDCIGLRMHPYE